MKNVADVYPLTPMQQGLLFHSLYAPGSGLYVEQLSCTISGNLDTEIFEDAWLRVIRRHAILRTAFLWEGLDEPLQVVRHDVNVPIAELYWEELTPETQQRQLEILLQADRARGFDLSKCPLMRLNLIHLGESRYQLVWSFHHLLLDGWSTFLVLGEVLAICEAAAHQRNPQLLPNRPFRDYIAWHQQQDQQKAKAFWQKALQGITGPTQLPLLKDAVNGSRHADDYHSEQIVLSEELTLALVNFARRQRLTLNTLVQGAWSLLLSRYSGEEYVTFGITVSGRPASLTGVEKMVGLFINTLPLRVRVPEQITLSEWLRQLQQQQIELREFDYSSLAEVQRQSGLMRGQLLFENLLVFENYPIDKTLQKNTGSLRIDNLEILEKTNYPLNLLIRPGPSQLTLQIVYDPARCDGALIGRMTGHLRNVLEGFVARPEQCLSSISLLSAAGERQVLRDWSDTATAWNTEASLPQLFEEQVERTPGAVALTFEDQHLSYRELNQRANRLARYLRRLGVGRDEPVGIMMERSLELVVGLLGILKAGGAYVPFDPSYPEKRLAFMMKDARVKVLLTQTRWAKICSQAAQIICLDEDKEIDGHDETNPSYEVSPQNLIYVIYTSGSTGQPKGVMNTHGGVCNRMLWMQSAYGLTEGDCVLQKTPYSFDVSAWEFFWPLITGARMVLAKPEGHRDSDYLLELINKEKVTTLHFVPSMLQVFLETRGVESCRSVKRVICSGEALPFELQQRFFARMSAELHNLYGPTECAVDVTFWECRRDDNRKLVPIGKPIANTQMYVLDRQQRAVPVGVTGELYIGGDGLARGYLNRADLTAEKFVPHPYSERAGERLYRTGDVGQWLSDGSIEYLGRIDEQVKIRGFRIELGEIEVALQQHPAIREAVVTVREAAAQQKQLVAYLVPAESGVISTAELRQYLKAILPDYMIPQSFVTLSQMPLTPNGKVDRRALPEPESRAESEAIVAAQTPVEEVLVGIWNEVLGVVAGTDDDFFALGGHSLLATQVVSRAREAFGVDLTLRQLFEKPTPRQLASVVERELARGDGVTAPPLVKAERSRELPLSFAQQRLWFIDQMEPGSTFYNSPVAVRLMGELNVDTLERAFSEIVRRHEVLRTTYKATDNEPVQVISPPPQTFHLPVIDFTHLANEQRENEALRFAREESLRPFDLSRGPLLRVKLLRLSETENILLLVMHHSITDEWSMGVLVKEVTALYEAFVKGEPSPLADLPVQYADFAVWQREWLQDAVLDEKLSYWRQQLSDAPSLLRLPIDHPRPAVQTVRGLTHTFVLPDSLHLGLKKLSRQEGCTLFMTLMAAFKVLLYRYSQQSDILVGAAVSNRPRNETEALIGFFVNTLVMRTNLGGNPSFRELMYRVRETTLSAYAHQDVPFEKIVEAVAPGRDMNYTPLIQVLFGMRNAPMHDLKLAGLRVQVIDLEESSGRFDLTLWMTEKDGSLQGKWYYNSDLFEAGTIRRIQGHLETLLQSVVDRPEERLKALEMYTAAEKEQRLNDRRAREDSNIQRLRNTKRRSSQGYAASHT